MTASVTRQTGFGHLTGLPCIKLQYGAASAVISLYGAQVLSYQPAEGDEKLWLSPKAQWHNNTPIRGGVPVCWPWFGPASAVFNPHRSALPSHGLVRNRLWQLSQQHSCDNAVSVTLAIKVDDLPHTAGTVLLQLTLTLADSLSIRLHCNSAIPQQGALHSYFNIGQIDSVLVSPLPASWYDKVSDAQQHDKTGGATIGSETDRVYSGSADRLRLDCITGALAIGQQGHDASVVWNPWQARSQAIADLASDSYRQFVCVETAWLNTQSNALNLTQQIQAL